MWVELSKCGICRRRKKGRAGNCSLCQQALRERDYTLPYATFFQKHWLTIAYPAGIFHGFGLAAVYVMLVVQGVLEPLQRAYPLNGLLLIGSVPLGQLLFALAARRFGLRISKGLQYATKEWHTALKKHANHTDLQLLPLNLKLSASIVTRAGELLGIKDRELVIARGKSTNVVRYAAAEIFQVEVLSDAETSSKTVTESQKEGVIARAALGGAAFGTTGALIGALSADETSVSQTSFTTRTDYTLVIHFRNPKQRSLHLSFGDAKREVHEWCAKINALVQSQS